MRFTGTPTWAEIINAAVAIGTSNVGVALPGNVVSYSDGVATIRPGVRRLVPMAENRDLDEAEELPIIHGVRVMWPRGRNFQIVGTLSAGDPVLLVCCDFDISAWLQSGKLADPIDARAHSWGEGAVAIPGLVPDSEIFPTPGDAAALASKVDAVVAALSEAFAPSGVAIPPDGAEAALFALAGVLDGLPSSASSVLKVSS